MERKNKMNCTYSEDVEKYRNCFVSKEGPLYNNQVKDVVVYEYKPNNKYKNEIVKNGKYIVALKEFNISERRSNQPCVVIKADNPYCTLIDKTLKLLHDKKIDVEYPYDFYPLFWTTDKAYDIVLNFLINFFPGTIVNF
jgi:hypothetical protein